MAIKNPELIILPVAIIISSGQRGIRKAIINKPATVGGEIASFFVPSLVTKAVKPAAKALKGLKIPGKLKNLLNKLNRFKSIRYAKNRILYSVDDFAKATPRDITKGLKFKTAPDKTFRFPFKDKDGIVRFFDSASKKKIRKFVRGTTKSISDDIIESFIIANKKVKKFKKAGTRALRLTLEKERRALRITLTESKKITQKAIRLKPTGKGFPFQDIKTRKIRFFKSRKDWLRAIKTQDRFLKTKEGTRLLRKLAKSKTSPQRLAIEKQRRVLRRELAESKKTTQKAIIIKPTSKGFPFQEYSTGEIRVLQES